MKKNKTRWHRLLGTLLDELLTPVGISVQCDVKVMVNPPEADILLLRRKTAQWTTEQLIRLPNGIRETKASHILLEFKCTESFNEETLHQTVSYDYFYKSANKLSKKNLQSFLITAKTPRPATLKQFSYQQTQYKGVYFTPLPLAQHVILIVLNELSNEPHNAWIKCFASRRLEKRKAFSILKEIRTSFIPLDLEYFLSGLWRHWFNNEEDFNMSNADIELTPEKVMEMGKFWGKSYLSLLKPEELLAGLDAKERLAGLDAKEFLSVLSIEEIEKFLEQRKKQ
jgi:hypothetical protein